MAERESSPLVAARKPKFFYGYIVVMAAIGIQVIAFGIFNTFGVFFKPIQNEFGWSRATISGAGSIRSLIFGLLAIIVGSLNDRFGPRITMTVCGFFFGLGHLLMSRVNSIGQLYLFYGVIVGVGASALDVVLLSTVARWFVKKRGMISGITKAGTGLGMLIMPLVASRLISAYGWDTAYVVLGSIILIVVIPLAFLLRRDPGEMQLLPDGEEQINAAGLDSAEAGFSLREASRTRQLWTICAVYLTIIFCAQTILVHIAPHAVDLGISATDAAIIVSVVGGVSIAGRLVMGNAGDRIGNKRAMVICFALLVAALSWLQFARELWMLYLFAAVYGFAHGGFFALLSPLIAGLFGTRSQGTTLGIVLFGGQIGGAIGPLLTGYIFDTRGSYQLAFLILLAFATTGLILMTSLRPTAIKED